MQGHDLARTVWVSLHQRERSPRSLGSASISKVYLEISTHYIPEGSWASCDGCPSGSVPQEGDSSCLANRLPWRCAMGGSSYASVAKHTLAVVNGVHVQKPYFEALISTWRRSQSRTKELRPSRLSAPGRQRMFVVRMKLLSLPPEKKKDVPSRHVPRNRICSKKERIERVSPKEQCQEHGRGYARDVEGGGIMNGCQLECG